MPPQLDKKRHAKYFQRLLQIVPSRFAEFDSSRPLIAFFAISGLDILNSLNDLSEETKLNAIDWIYSLQITEAGPRSGFKVSTAVPKDAIKYQSGHLTITYTALASLLILGDDLSRVDRKSIIEGLKSCQNPNGTFTAMIEGCESDMRFLYCACCISAILDDWSGIDKPRAIDYILQSVSYDGGIGQGPGLESHGGSTFCAIASLCLMDELYNVLSEDQLSRLKSWCLMRQEGGFQGRPGKTSDTCYSFWVGATLHLLNVIHLSDREANRMFLLDVQDSITGGFPKFYCSLPDPLHTYFGLCGLSLAGEDGLSTMHAALSISERAHKHLLKIHKVWQCE